MPIADNNVLNYLNMCMYLNFISTIYKHVCILFALNIMNFRRKELFDYKLSSCQSSCAIVLIVLLIVKWNSFPLVWYNHIKMRWHDCFAGVYFKLQLVYTYI